MIGKVVSCERLRTSHFRERIRTSHKTSRVFVRWDLLLEKGAGKESDRMRRRTCGLTGSDDMETIITHFILTHLLLAKHTLSRSLNTPAFLTPRLGRMHGWPEAATDAPPTCHQPSHSSAFLVHELSSGRNKSTETQANLLKPHRSPSAPRAMAQAADTTTVQSTFVLCTCLRQHRQQTPKCARQMPTMRSTSRRAPISYVFSTQFISLGTLFLQPGRASPIVPCSRKRFQATERRKP
jgi:hypothetical protein